MEEDKVVEKEAAQSKETPNAEVEVKEAESKAPAEDTTNTKESPEKQNDDMGEISADEFNDHLESVVNEVNQKLAKTEKKKSESFDRILLQKQICDIVYEVKYNRNYDRASELIAECGFSFEKLLIFTSRLSFDDLIILAEKEINKKEDK